MIEFLFFAAIPFVAIPLWFAAYEISVVAMWLKLIFDELSRIRMELEKRR